MGGPARRGYPQKLSADAAGGTLPDVVNVSPDLAYPLAKAGLALDLEKAAGKYRGEYLDGAWRSHRMPGMPGVYAFPWYLNTGPMFYNKELFAKAGLDPEKPPTSYDQLFKDAVSMARKSGRRIAILAGTPSIEDFGRYGVRLMNTQERSSPSTNPRASSCCGTTRSSMRPGRWTRRRSPRRPSPPGGSFSSSPWP